MFYESTRGGMRNLTSAEAIKRGLAPDGGLFVPQTAVKLTPDEIYGLAAMNYRERAVFILGRFLDDYTPEELRECVDGAYGSGRFEKDLVAPIRKLSNNAYVLELWHGPTCAFKDVALQILPRLLVKANLKTDEKTETVILVATSGDTGKAALEGFRDVNGTRIIVFFPEGGVSQIQKMQMVTQEGSNVCSVAVKGNFDDTQNGVKQIFSDVEMGERMLGSGYKFSSANSINWGRLVPQIVYYFSAYADLVASGEIKAGEKINFTVPTGNFGNILAAWYARSMGLPVNKLICASNDNNVLTEFINTGLYNREREFRRTISPSMDILISSNLERLLYELSGHDSQQIRDWMGKLSREGRYYVNGDVRRRISELFWASFTTEQETMDTIKAVYEDYGYVVDTHTAVGIDAYDKYVISTGDLTKTVIASTASPFKFNESVVRAIFGDKAAEGKNEFELLGYLSEQCGIGIPAGLSGLDRKDVLHTRVCGRQSMKDEVVDILGLK
ncbi:MAG TPA: threonine synthase [Clostridia bacterium]|nr:threonine synthase [Clostridia bacterium]